MLKKENKQISSREVFSYGFISIEEDAEKYKNTVISDYSTYQNIMEYYQLTENLEEKDFKEKSYLVVIADMGYCGGSLTGIKESSIVDTTIFIKIGQKVSCGPCAKEHYLYLIPFYNTEIPNNYTVEYEYITENKITCDPDISWKPMIYLYPKEEMQVTVKLLKEEKITTTYPKYQDKWTVLAKPNGDLIDPITGRSFYGLYWEGLNTVSKGIQEEGFVVRGEEVATFLEEKLSILGLTERESNEFIVYWLPKMENNFYNYIRFETMEEINYNMPLKIDPAPDSIIRINMEYKKLDEKIEVKEQSLKTPIRSGFVVVEWGGTELQ